MPVQSKLITLTQTRISERTVQERSRKFVVLSPPFPKDREWFSFDDEKWQVTKVEDIEILYVMPKDSARGEHG